MIDGTRNRLSNIFYEKLGRDNENLLWQLRETLNNLPFERLLDVGAGMRVSKKICLPNGVKKAFVFDPDGQVLDRLMKDYRDARIEAIQEKIETARLEDTSFDLAFFIMSLLWIDDPLTALQKVASRSPAYIVIVKPELTTEQQREISLCFPEHTHELNKQFDRYDARKLDVDAIMESNEYYPLVVLSSAASSDVPKHRLRTVLYTKEKPDRVPYDKAKYIVQVNSVCNSNCLFCFVDRTGEQMDREMYQNIIKKTNANEIICLRGGEPTLTGNLIADYINPALKKGIHVVLESNGAFINSALYQDYLEVLTQKNIEIRLSFDRQHIDSYHEKFRPFKVGMLSRFIHDATRLKINFGLFSLGMSREQVKIFLEEYSVASWLRYIRPLTKYSDITELPIRCKFVDVGGAVHDHITGLGWIGDRARTNRM